MMNEPRNLRKGHIIEIEGQPYEVLDIEFTRQGKIGIFFNLQIKNIFTGAVHTHTAQSHDRFPTARIETRKMQFVRQFGKKYTFRDPENGEKVSLSEGQVEASAQSLKKQDTAVISFCQRKPFLAEKPLWEEAPEGAEDMIIYEGYDAADDVHVLKHTADGKVWEERCAASDCVFMDGDISEGMKVSVFLKLDEETFQIINEISKA